MHRARGYELITARQLARYLSFGVRDGCSYEYEQTYLVCSLRFDDDLWVSAGKTFQGSAEVAVLEQAWRDADAPATREFVLFAPDANSVWRLLHEATTYSGAFCGLVVAALGTLSPVPCAECEEWLVRTRRGIVVRDYSSPRVERITGLGEGGFPLSEALVLSPFLQCAYLRGLRNGRCCNCLFWGCSGDGCSLADARNHALVDRIGEQFTVQRPVVNRYRQCPGDFDFTVDGIMRKMVELVNAEGAPGPLRERCPLLYGLARETGVLDQVLSAVVGTRCHATTPGGAQSASPHNRRIAGGQPKKRALSPDSVAGSVRKKPHRSPPRNDCIDDRAFINSLLDGVKM